MLLDEIIKKLCNESREKTSIQEIQNRDSCLLFLFPNNEKSQCHTHFGNVARYTKGL